VASFGAHFDWLADRKPEAGLLSIGRKFPGGLFWCSNIVARSDKLYAHDTSAQHFPAWGGVQPRRRKERHGRRLA
jgi:hypothetical protein